MKALTDHSSLSVRHHSKPSELPPPPTLQSFVVRVQACLGTQLDVRSVYIHSTDLYLFTWHRDEDFVAQSRILSSNSWTPVEQTSKQKEKSQ